LRAAIGRLVRTSYGRPEGCVQGAWGRWLADRGHQAGSANSPDYVGKKPAHITPHEQVHVCA